MITSPPMNLIRRLSEPPDGGFRPFRDEDIEQPIEEIDIGRDDAPARARAWGSPTILIDGQDVTGVAPPSGEIGCRLYARGAPSVDQIRRCLHAAQGTTERGEP